MSKRKNTTNRTTAYDHITRSILNDLKQGVAPWVKPWAAGPVQAHQNAITGHKYTGINKLLTWMAAAANGYTDPRWLTKRQISNLGGSFKGESPTWITFAKPFKTTEKKGDGTAQEEEKPRGGMYLKAYMVWNAQQVQGLTLPDIEPTTPFTDRIEEIDQLIAATGATIRHGGNRAAYHPVGDVITMPQPGTFEDAGNYYATLLHELVHWTGGKARLDRDFTGRFDKEAYAFEELIAELGAAFLCAELGVPGRLQHSEYIGNWIKVLESDKKAVVTAASQAQTAVNFLLDQAGLQQLEKEAA